MRYNFFCFGSLVCWKQPVSLNLSPQLCSFFFPLTYQASYHLKTILGSIILCLDLSKTRWLKLFQCNWFYELGDAEQCEVRNEGSMLVVTLPISRNEL